MHDSIDPIHSSSLSYRPVFLIMSKKNKKPERENLKQNRDFRYPWTLILFGLTFLIYLATSRFDFTTEDSRLISKNDLVREGWKGIPRLFTTLPVDLEGRPSGDYTPLSQSIFAVEGSLFGMDPRPMHFFQVIYYCLLCVLVYRFMFLILPAWPKKVSLAIALLFAFHPLHTEVVASLKNRDEILAALGILSALILCLRTPNGTIKQAALVFLAAGLAFFSRDHAWVLILLAPLSVWSFNRDGFKNQVLNLSAMGLAALLFFIFKYGIAGVTAPILSLEENALMIFTGLERVWAAFALAGHALRLFLFPVSLMADYSYDHLNLSGWSDPWAYLGFLFIAAGIYFSVKGLKNKSIYSYAFLFGLAFYLPTSNILILNDKTFTESQLLLPSLGLIVLVVLIFLKGSEKYQLGQNNRLAMLVVVLGLYALQVFLRIPDWRNNKNIYTVTAATGPRNINAQIRLARVKYDESLYAETSMQKNQLLQEALSILDRAVRISNRFAPAYFVRGLVLEALNDRSSAIASFEAAAAVNPREGNFNFELGKIYVASDQPVLAMSQFQQAENKGVKSEFLYHEQAALYFKQGEFQKAIDQYLKAVEVNPADVFALSQITKIYRDQLQDITNALKYDGQLKEMMKK